MSELKLPTDPDARRNLEQRAMARGLPPIPEDSVLRRHYLQRLEVLLEPGTTSAAPDAAATGRPEPRPAPTPEAVGAGAPAAEPTSWFGRFLRKLGGG